MNVPGFLVPGLLRSRMRHVLSRTTMAVVGALALATAAPGGCGGHPTAPGMQDRQRLVWSDEFEMSGLPDPGRWTYDVGGSGWGNAELQFYTRGRSENARVENGHLVIEARREQWQSNDYTSARLVTKGRRDWTYGRFEARARLPKGRGSWPAIWMLPTTNAPMKWPDDGEIDIMEHVGFDPGTIQGSVHTKRYNLVIGTQKTGTLLVPDATDAFHVYAIEWSASRIRWLVDDREYFSFAREEGGRDVWPFDGAFHFILNIAVGGTWGGQKGVDGDALPFRMEVDYVRVYQ